MPNHHIYSHTCHRRFANYQAMPHGAPRQPPPAISQRIRGITLLETLIAMLIGSVLLLATARLLPDLQRMVLQRARVELLREDLWQVAFTIGKHVQRAGFCKGECTGRGLSLLNGGSCLIVQWDTSHTSQQEKSLSASARQTGFRLRGASIETQRAVTDCQGQGWEKITDPGQLVIRQFQVTIQPRKGLPPLLHIVLAASVSATGQSVYLEHTVAGYNL